MGPLVIRVLGFAYYNIFITVNGKETFDLGVLGFACFNVFISVNDKEVFVLGVLGRGPRRANSDFI